MKLLVSKLKAHSCFLLWDRIFHIYKYHSDTTSDIGEKVWKRHLKDLEDE